LTAPLRWRRPANSHAVVSEERRADGNLSGGVEECENNFHFTTEGFGLLLRPVSVDALAGHLFLFLFK
jgi:hypothetical protein